MSSEKKVLIERSPYRIEQFPPRKLPAEAHPQVAEYSGLATEFLWGIYITCEWAIALSIQLKHSQWLWNMWLILFAEACASISEIMSLLNTLFALLATRETAGNRFRYKLVGDSAPSVDVMIPCCGEAVDVIMDTVKAVMFQDYPIDKFRLFILDDGKSASLREAVEMWKKETSSKSFPDLHYLSRVIGPGQKSYYKSGNLHFGIEETNRLGGSEYLASLDADMIPEKDWLRKMVPHLILEDGLALACPPQRYYNVPPTDPFGQQAEFDVFLDVYEPLDDRLDPAMCTGSGFVVKRKAIADIGGWPLVDSGEDFIGATVFSYNGWKVAYVREQLQTGLAPGSIRAHIKQRERWVDSGVIVHKHFKYYIPGFKVNSQMSWTVRGVGWLGVIREYAPIAHVLGLILLPLSTLNSQPLEFESPVSFKAFSWLQGVLLASFVARKFNDRVLFGSVGQSRTANLFSNDVWCAPYTAVRCILSLLPSRLHAVSFISTAAIVSDINERSHFRRKRLPYRLLNIDFLMPGAYVFIVLGLAYQFPFDPSCKLLAGPIIKLSSSLWKMAVPVVYILSPPTVPERDDLIAKDEDGNNRPTEKAINAACGNVTTWSWGDLVEILTLCWYMSSS